MIAKRIAVPTLAALLCMLAAGDLYAADTLASFTTTLQKLEVSKDSGDTFFTIFDNSNVAVDLVALSGSQVGTFLGESNIAAGFYNRSRVIVSAVTIVFTVDGTGASGATNLSAGTTGTLTINIATTAGAPSLPLREEQSIAVTMNAGGTTSAVIDFDAQTSFSGLTYTDNDGAGAGTAVTLTGLTFDPVITVAG